jgi:hypothetical protein
MAGAAGDSLVAGIIVGAASWVVGILGVEPSTVFVAASACFLGSPFAAPSRGPVHAMLVFVSSVVVTCHAAASLAVAAGMMWPSLAVHERRAQAAAAIVVGVGLHIVVSHVPTILKAVGLWMAKKLGVQA